MAKRIVATDNVIPDAGDINGIDPSMYNDVARCAELLSVQLIESNFTISPKFFEEDNQYRNGIDFSHLHASFDEKSRVASCIFQFEEFRKKDRRKIFSLRDRFAIFYRISFDCDENHAVAFATKTGVMVCYPYFRAHAAETASLANAEMPILPTIASLPLKKGARK